MEGETVRISLVGELDTATAPRFHEEAPAALDGAGAVIVDCAALTFVDSKGIAALLQLKLCADQHQIELQVQNVSAMARRVLDILGLLDILEVQMPSESQDSEPDETAPS
jgi:anti-anti-sigma factor